MSDPRASIHSPTTKGELMGAMKDLVNAGCYYCGEDNPTELRNYGEIVAICENCATLESGECV